MSIQTYNQPVYYDGRTVEYNPNTGEITGASELTEKKGVAMEFQVNLKVLRGRDSWAVRTCNYTIVGHNDTALTNNAATMGPALYALIEAGSRAASNIAYLSKGVIVGFYAKLGKYRQDEMPINVPTGDNSFSDIIITNNLNDEYGQDECNRTDSFPMMPASMRVRIPWQKDNLSRQDVKETITLWEYLDNDTGMTFHFGQVRFTNDNKTDMSALPCGYIQRVRVGEYSKKLGGFLVNNDSSIGIKSDDVLSQEYNSVVDGVDDD